MNKMNKMKNYLLTLVLGLTLSAQAAVFNLGITPGQPADPTSETFRLNGQINIWNLATDPDLPNVDQEWIVNQADTPNAGASYTLDLEGFTGYVLLKWGNMDQFYYVDGATSITFDSTIYNDRNKHWFDDLSKPLRQPLGLSHYTTWEVQSVPEGGIGLAAMMIGFGGLVFARKKMGA